MHALSPPLQKKTKHNHESTYILDKDIAKTDIHTGLKEPNSNKILFLKIYIFEIHYFITSLYEKHSHLYTNA